MFPIYRINIKSEKIKWNVDVSVLRIASRNVYPRIVSKIHTLRVFIPAWISLLSLQDWQIVLRIILNKTLNFIQIPFSQWKCSTVVFHPHNNIISYILSFYVVCSSLLIRTLECFYWIWRVKKWEGDLPTYCLWIICNHGKANMFVS